MSCAKTAEPIQIPLIRVGKKPLQRTYDPLYSVPTQCECAGSTHAVDKTAVRLIVKFLWTLVIKPP